ncbi:MAG: tRNA threonylcarbamoyladenosine dehydratase [Spirochaetes bacterium ADurb.Bin110]|nr:MAG: tRNA threonylcarbamoyladenosine dehydratase [Spirochaetes bacterium ADurb.Bin110]
MAEPVEKISPSQRTEGSFLDRTRIIAGDEGLARLADARVAIYGLGGVGAACALDLVRAGVGYLHVIDYDIVEYSNLNRLAFGYNRYAGLAKTEAFTDAAREINPAIQIVSEKSFFSAESAAQIVARECSFHADCIDSLSPKVNLIASLYMEHLAFISSMGTAGRIMPESLRLGKMQEVKGCPLARAVRQRLGKRAIPLDFPVVWSDEPPTKPFYLEGKRGIQGSMPFVPQTAGHIMASWIVRTILKKQSL